MRKKAETDALQSARIQQMEGEAMVSEQIQQSKFTFPRTKFVSENGLTQQFIHICTEVKEIKEAHEQEPIERVAEELVDLYHSVETALRIIDERYIDINKVFEQVAEKNMRRGYYGSN